MTRFARHERAQHADSQIDKINLRIVSVFFSCSCASIFIIKSPARLHFCMPLPDSGTERQQKCRQRTVPCLQKNTASESVSTRRWAQHEPYTCNTSGNRASRYGTCGPPHLKTYRDMLQQYICIVNRQYVFYLTTVSNRQLTNDIAQ